MSDTSQGPGWWQASDGRWYAPELHPDFREPQVEGDARPPSEPSSLRPSSSRTNDSSGSFAHDMVVAAADKWRRQLIDLGGRNNLLYYKDRKTGSLDLSPEAGADEIVVGRLITLGRARLSELYGLDRDQLAAAAKRAGDRKRKLQEELGGAGTQYPSLSLGFCDLGRRPQQFSSCAPILMRQAVLASRGGAADDFDLGLEGEWTINPTCHMPCEPISKWRSIQSNLTT